MRSSDLFAKTVRLEAAGRKWKIRHPADLYTLLEEALDDEAPGGQGGFSPDDDIPYWVELWPSSVILADWLQHNAEALRGRNCLDLGCGLGLTAMCAALAGARVLAVDYIEDALSYAERNAELNNAPGVEWAVMDWNSPALAQGAFELIWGGDIMYERAFAEPVLACLDYALAPGGRCWIAEPERRVYGHFLALLDERGWRGEQVYTAPAPPLGQLREAERINVWELVRK